MANKEDDFLWLLNTLKNAASDFQTLYGIGFAINDIIILKQGEPKHWVFMDEKGRIKTKDEEWLKFSVIKEYFKNPRIKQEDLNEIENYNEIQYSNLILQNELFRSKTDKMLFYFYQKVREISVIRPASSISADLLMSKPSDYQEFLNHWTKIIGYYPINSYKGNVLYQVTYNGRTKRCNIERRNIESKKLDSAEFLKKEGSQKKTFKFEQKLFKSLASLVNEKCNLFLTSLVRFLETKYHKTIAEMVIEFFMNDSGQIYLSGADKINFFGNDGEIDNTLDKNNLQQTQVPQMEEFKCVGQYCDCSGDTTYYDETDEAFSVFIQPQKKDTVFHIQYKSILMDHIERYKTIQSIKNVQKGVKITEQLIFKVRKFYSFSQIAASQLFQHYKFDNIYKRIRVCEFCYAMYSKLDSMRAENLSQKKRKAITDADIIATIEKMANSQGIIIGGTQLKERKTLSSLFYQKLDYFDNEAREFQNNFVLTQSVDPTYFSSLPKTRSETGKNFFSMTQQQTEKEKEFVLPKIVEITLRDKNKMYINKKKKFVSKQEAEALGLKHYLGHTKNLPYSDCGLAISKSSLALNQLQDKIREVENLKNKIENEKIKKVVEEIELIMCPYYGNGKVDIRRLESFIQVLKQREQTYAVDIDYSPSKSTKKVQVVTDKNEFLTENQRKQKQDKEKKAKEIEENKKSFLEENRELAASIIKMREETRLQKTLDKRKKDAQQKQSLYANDSDYGKNSYYDDYSSKSRGSFQAFKIDYANNNLNNNLRQNDQAQNQYKNQASQEAFDSQSQSDDGNEDDENQSQINNNPERYRPNNFPLFQNDD